MSAALEPRALGDDLRVLIHRVRPWSTTRWARGDNSAVAYQLVLELLALTRRLSADLPAEATPLRLGDHALADQLAVVGAMLVEACQRGQVSPDTTAPRAPDVVGDARRLVREAGRQLS